MKTVYKQRKVRELLGCEAGPLYANIPALTKNVVTFTYKKFKRLIDVLSVENPGDSERQIIIYIMHRFEIFGFIKIKEHQAWHYDLPAKQMKRIVKILINTNRKTINRKVIKMAGE